MDRYDLETIGAMLLGSLGVGLNLIFLQATEAVGAPQAKLVLIPIFAGLAVSLSGFVSDLRRHGRDMVIVDRICAGMILYVALSVACAVFFQPRFD